MEEARPPSVHRNYQGPVGHKKRPVGAPSPTLFQKIKINKTDHMGSSMDIIFAQTD